MARQYATQNFSRNLLAVSLLSILTTSSYASDESQQVSLTIYNNDLALVEETRQLNLAQGRNKIEFKNVSASIRPETVALNSAGVEIVEQNFDFDLLTPEKLIEKSVGETVQLVRVNPATGAQVTEQAKVLSANQGVVLQVGNHIEVLREDNLPTRVLFDKVPENLRAKPTLSVTLNADKAASQPAVLSYLSRGFSWKADYVALLTEKQGKLDMQGWITLTNNSGTNFSNAKTQLIAGKINTLSDDGNNYEWRQRQARVSGAAGTENGARPSLADYYVYPLKEKTTVANNQTKQVSFLEAQGVSAKKTYYYLADWFSSQSEPQHADVVVQFKTLRRQVWGRNYLLAWPVFMCAMPKETLNLWVKTELRIPRKVPMWR